MTVSLAGGIKCLPDGARGMQCSLYGLTAAFYTLTYPSMKGEASLLPSPTSCVKCRTIPSQSLPRPASPSLVCPAVPRLASPLQSPPAAPCLPRQSTPRHWAPCLTNPCLPIQAKPRHACPRPSPPCLALPRLPQSTPSRRLWFLSRGYLANASVGTSRSVRCDRHELDPR